MSIKLGPKSSILRKIYDPEKKGQIRPKIDAPRKKFKIQIWRKIDDPPERSGFGP